MISAERLEGFGRTEKIGGSKSVEEIKKKVLDEEERERAFDAAETDEELLIIRMLYETGCRRGELAALTPTDINFDSDRNPATVRIDKTMTSGGKVQNHPKVKDGNRTVAISEETKNLLHKHIREEDIGEGERIFPYSRGTIYQRVKSVFTRANVRVEKEKTKVTPHWLRHTRATDMVKEGFSKEKVQQYLGHSSVINSEVYTHFSDDDVVELY
ncbi:MAG: tyrosine-type recombinase/integrase [Candidatus Aenigmatarchaeota archaeon]